MDRTVAVLMVEAMGTVSQSDVLNWRNYGMRVTLPGDDEREQWMPLSVFWPVYEATFGGKLEEGITVAAFGAAVAIARSTGSSLAAIEEVYEAYKVVFGALLG